MDPAKAELRRRSRAYWARLRGYLAGRQVIQVKDLWLAAGLDPHRYADNEYMELHHAEVLLKLGYRPVVVPALSGRLSVLVLVRDPWISEGIGGDGFERFLGDGDPLMALLVGRARRVQRE